MRLSAALPVALLATTALAPPTLPAEQPGDAAREYIDTRPVDPDTTAPDGTVEQLDRDPPREATGAELDLSLPLDWTGPEPVDDVPLSLSVEDAVLLTLENNRSLASERLQPAIAGTFEAVERAVFDPVIFGEISIGRDRVVQQFQEVDEPPEERRTETERIEGGLRQALPTGTELELSVRSDRADRSGVEEQYASRLGVTLTQALLQGGRIDSNLASLRQAEIDTLASVYELRGFAEALVAEVESAYWGYVLADEQVAIFEEALDVAEQQLEETRRRISVGDRPETDETAAQAEVALRRQGLIDVRSQRESARLSLLRLMNPPGATWDTTLEAQDEPDVIPLPLGEVRDHVQLGRGLRPDLNEARLQIRRGELEVVRTRDGMLPRLDFFVTLGKTGYADSFGDSWRDVDGPGYDFRAGIQVETPVFRRAEEAQQDRALFNREQAGEAVANLRQLVDLDVRNAWLEVERTREQVDAVAVTRRLQEEVLRAEQARFEVGETTALVVAQAQRDLLESQLEEVEAAISWRQAVTELHRQSGTLLLRRGIGMPGDEEVLTR
ncbi:TolC family protein [Aquisalimonas asiatica]|uniref:Outer membrane protein TolC n=1 Tax=Aquisalimonas asiatica TaxID=406100 RepID=A0A1H8V4B5_9GAMM|nr:TolC family protein [Aquisalimonas asiatica]SEP09608.1 Outer membrane protein TolC [Aquisalimonas asiatica]